MEVGISAGLTRWTVRHQCFAAAELFLQFQSQFRHRLESRAYRPVAFIEYVSYDETTVHCRLTFDEDAEAQTQRAKVWVVRTDYHWLLEHLVHDSNQVHPNAALEEGNRPGQSQFVAFSTSSSPALRAAAASDGDTTKRVLDTTPQPPAGAGAGAFPLIVRAVEVDEYGGNLRAEKLILQERAKGGRRWTHCLSLCLCHKLHNTAQRCWGLLPSTISGLIHASKILSLSGNTTRLKDACTVILNQKLEIVSDRPVTHEATAFKNCVRALFGPPRHKHLQSSVADTLFELLNHDWRESDVIRHVCRGCCASPMESQRKIVAVFRKFISTFHAQIFNRGELEGMARRIAILRSWICHSQHSSRSISVSFLLYITQCGC